MSQLIGDFSHLSNFMNRLEQLTANRSLCEHLVEMGILPTAIIWHLAEDDQEAIAAAELAGNELEETPVKWDTCLLQDPEPFPGVCVPAWTKAELDVMIGPLYPKPDLFTQKELGQSKTQEAETYPLFMPNKMVVCEVGADASAQALIFLLEQELLTVDTCNYRYMKVFLKSGSKPAEK